MILHLFTGSKGGIGKTRCAISLAMYYLLGGSEKPFLESQSKNIPNRYKLNVFDANSNSIDFYTIMTGRNFQELAGMKKGNFINNFLKENFLKVSYETGTLPFDGYVYIRKSPFELFQGVSDFWENVYEAAKLTREDERDVLVIDTNMAVSNLVSENPVQKNKMKVIFKKLKEIDATHIVIWYIWCLNDFLSIRENLTFDTSQKIEMLDKICRVDAEQIGSKINLYVIHVLNPYLFFEKSSGFKSILNIFLSNQTSSTLLDNAGIGVNLPFDMAEIIRYIIKDHPDMSYARWDEVMEQIGKVNETGVNIVVLRDQKENHTYIKDQLSYISLNKIRNLEMIHKKNFGEDSLWKKLNEFHRWVRA